MPKYFYCCIFLAFPSMSCIALDSESNLFFENCMYIISKLLFINNWGMNKNKESFVYNYGSTSILTFFLFYSIIYAEGYRHKNPVLKEINSWQLSGYKQLLQWIQCIYLLPTSHLSFSLPLKILYSYMVSDSVFGASECSSKQKFCRKLILYYDIEKQ